MKYVYSGIILKTYSGIIQQGQFCLMCYPLFFFFPFFTQADLSLHAFNVTETFACVFIVPLLVDLNRKANNACIDIIFELVYCQYALH